MLIMNTLVCCGTLANSFFFVFFTCTAHCYSSRYFSIAANKQEASPTGLLRVDEKGG